MNTTLEEVIALYLAKIENFDYLQYSEEELLEELSPMLLSATSEIIVFAKVIPTRYFNVA